MWKDKWDRILDVAATNLMYLVEAMFFMTILRILLIIYNLIKYKWEQ